ncbi:MAG TPA: DUF4173 domain-containing protein, partial [Longimicrobiaceae bacterium]|nr:DUF4173 domain-containing protein [Longimicrobiaceae bacterium]
IASALHRMRLYQAAYGLTELRLYTTAFMLWLSAVFAWLAVTVLRGRRERFAFGAVVAALEALVVLHAVNPDALIVRVNTGRADAAVRFDARYAASLSADAVPALLAALPRLPAADRCLAAERLRARWDGEGESWRAWSLGRGRALRTVAARDAELRALACPPALVREASSAPATPAAPAPAVSTLPPAGVAASRRP